MRTPTPYARGWVCLGACLTFTPKKKAQHTQFPPTHLDFPTLGGTGRQGRVQTDSTDFSLTEPNRFSTSADGKSQAVTIEMPLDSGF